jgi:hypothetical protein
VCSSDLVDHCQRLFQDEFKIHELEHQAKGLEDMYKYVDKCGSKSLMSFLLIEEANELRTQAKTTKDHNNENS